MPRNNKVTPSSGASVLKTQKIESAKKVALFSADPVLRALPGQAFECAKSTIYTCMIVNICVAVLVLVVVIFAAEGAVMRLIL
jgi:hypothetical protein